jgi:hypothetical protein
MFTSKVTSSSVSSDGETVRSLFSHCKVVTLYHAQVKLLVQLQDGLSVEAVIMTYAGNSSSEDCPGKSRATVCVSSEVGCQMGCTFCATGTMGLIAELTPGEIVEQLVHARAVKTVRNVVFMGMGEPLNNYNAVAAAIRLMIHPQIFALKQRSITVSTVGVVHRLAALARDLPGVSLALSLHAPNQELRRLIVPSAQAFKLDKLMAAVDAYMAATGNRVFIECASSLLPPPSSLLPPPSSLLHPPSSLLPLPPPSPLLPLPPPACLVSPSTLTPRQVRAAGPGLQLPRKPRARAGAAAARPRRFRQPHPVEPCSQPRFRLQGAARAHRLHVPGRAEAVRPAVHGAAGEGAGRVRGLRPACPAAAGGYAALRVARSRNAALQGLQSNAVKDVEDIASGGINGCAVLCK